MYICISIYVETERDRERERESNSVNSVSCRGFVVVLISCLGFLDQDGSKFSACTFPSALP